MNNVLIPFYDNIHDPTKILSYGVLNSEDGLSLYNNVERPNTPYWRLDRKPIDGYLAQNSFIFDKKTFFKLYNTGLHKNLVDVNTSLWHNNHDVFEFDYEDYDRTPINYYLNTLQELDFDKLTYNISDKYNYLLKASAILDGTINVGGKTIRKTYDHYTSTGRLRDTTGQTLSMKKTLRNKVKAKGVLIELDMDSFHLRILNEFINGGMPEQMRGHDWIVRQAGLDRSKEDPKVQIFRAIYSQNFDLVDCEFFRKLKSSYKLIDSPFGRTHHNFNYIIQEYEVLLMSRIICSINVDYVDFLFYLYDGLYLDLKDPSKIQDFVIMLKDNIKLPFTVKVGEVEKRFY